MLYKRRERKREKKKSQKLYKKIYRYKIDNEYQKAKIKNLEQSLEFQKCNVKEKKGKKKKLFNYTSTKKPSIYKKMVITVVKWGIKVLVTFTEYNMNMTKKG